MRALALLGIGACACGHGEAAAPVLDTAPAAPAGTVLLVDDLPLSGVEVAPLERDIRALYPEYTPVHARRLALTNEFFPRLAAHASHREGWERARSACEQAEPALGTLVPHEDDGNWNRLGLGLWSAARALAPGEWSPPVELIGRWVRLRLDELRPHSDPRKEELHVSMIEFPYLDRTQLAATIDAAVDRARLTIVDPDWGEVVPETWKRRMRGAKP